MVSTTILRDGHFDVLRCPFFSWNNTSCLGFHTKSIICIDFSKHYFNTEVSRYLYSTSVDQSKLIICFFVLVLCAVDVKCPFIDKKYIRDKSQN